jgi:hypothetical protein
LSLYGTLSTARNSFARKPVFQANLQIRSLVFDIYQKKKFLERNRNRNISVRLG